MIVAGNPSDAFRQSCRVTIEFRGPPALATPASRRRLRCPGHEIPSKVLTARSTRGLLSYVVLNVWQMMNSSRIDCAPRLGGTAGCAQAAERTCVPAAALRISAAKRPCAVQSGTVPETRVEREHARSIRLRLRHCHASRGTSSMAQYSYRYSSRAVSL